MVDESAYSRHAGIGPAGEKRRYFKTDAFNTAKINFFS
jgi:hypothetical protein